MEKPAPQSNANAQPGTMIVVVGPSGAGKDTLMDIAARHFAGRNDVHFVRRVITRDADAGSEDHLGVSDREFDAMRAAGAFAVSWEAHGLKYGVPSDVRDHLGRGQLVIVNGSRSALPHFRSAFPRLKVFNITAQPEVLAERLEARGRESRDDILRRLARSSLDISGDYDVTTIDNSGSLDVAGKAVVDALEGVLRLLKQSCDLK